MKNSSVVLRGDDVALIEKIRKIIDCGNSAEVKRNKDGSYKVYEVRKNAV